MVAHIIINVDRVFLFLELNWGQGVLGIAWARDHSGSTKCRLLCFLNRIVKLSNIRTLFVSDSSWVKCITGIVKENLLFFYFSSWSLSPIHIVYHYCLRQILWVSFSNKRMTRSLSEWVSKNLPIIASRAKWTTWCLPHRICIIIEQCRFIWTLNVRRICEYLSGSWNLSKCLRDSSYCIVWNFCRFFTKWASSQRFRTGTQDRPLGHVQIVSW